jgi:hypothetical protein
MFGGEDKITPCRAGVRRHDSRRERVPLIARCPENLRNDSRFQQRLAPIDITPNTPMRTTDMSPVLTRLFSELVDGASDPTGAFILNSRDVGLLRSLEKLSADDASRSVNDGATIAAHAQHVRYGLSLMNRWANEGGNPFADAKWDEAWKTFDVDATEWENIRNGLREETHCWLQALSAPRDVTDAELAGMVASIAHLAYHLGAIRQIDKHARGPKEGTF